MQNVIIRFTDLDHDGAPYLMYMYLLRMYINHVKCDYRFYGFGPRWRALFLIFKTLLTVRIFQNIYIPGELSKFQRMINFFKNWNEVPLRWPHVIPPLTVGEMINAAECTAVQITTTGRKAVQATSSGKIAVHITTTSCSDNYYSQVKQLFWLLLQVKLQLRLLTTGKGDVVYILRTGNVIHCCSEHFLFK